MPGAHAVRRKLLAGQMDEPDVAGRAGRARLSSRKIGAASISVAVAEWLSSAPAAASRGAVAAARLLVAVFHVGRVVVVGHDHRPATVAAGNDDQQVAFLAACPPDCLSQPPDQGKWKVGLPAERQIANDRLARHPRLLDHPAVVFQQVIAQGLEIAVMVLQQRLRDRILHAIGVILVDVLRRGPAVRSSANRPSRTTRVAVR